MDCSVSIYVLECNADNLETECDRPIIWICHDIGASILKQVRNTDHTYTIPSQCDRE